MNLCVCVSKVGVSDKARRGLFCVRIGKLLKYNERGGTEKRGVERNMLKQEDELGQRVSALQTAE